MSQTKEKPTSNEESKETLLTRYKQEEAALLLIKAKADVKMMKKVYREKDTRVPEEKSFDKNRAHLLIVDQVDMFLDALDRDENIDRQGTPTIDTQIQSLGMHLLFEIIKRKNVDLYSFKNEDWHAILLSLKKITLLKDNNLKTHILNEMRAQLDDATYALHKEHDLTLQSFKNWLESSSLSKSVVLSQNKAFNVEDKTPQMLSKLIEKNERDILDKTESNLATLKKAHKDIIVANSYKLASTDKHKLNPNLEGKFYDMTHDGLHRQLKEIQERGHGKEIDYIANVLLKLTEQAQSDPDSASLLYNKYNQGFDLIEYMNLLDNMFNLAKLSRSDEVIAQIRRLMDANLNIKDDIALTLDDFASWIKECSKVDKNTAIPALAFEQDIYYDAESENEDEDEFFDAQSQFDDEEVDASTDTNALNQFSDSDVPDTEIAEDSEIKEILNESVETVPKADTTTPLSATDLEVPKTPSSELGLNDPELSDYVIINQSGEESKAAVRLDSIEFEKEAVIIEGPPPRLDVKMTLNEIENRFVSKKEFNLVPKKRSLIELLQNKPQQFLYPKISTILIGINNNLRGETYKGARDALHEKILEKGVTGRPREENSSMINILFKLLHKQIKNPAQSREMSAVEYLNFLDNIRKINLISNQKTLTNIQKALEDFQSNQDNLDRTNVGLFTNWVEKIANLKPRWYQRLNPFRKEGLIPTIIDPKFQPTVEMSKGQSSAAAKASIADAISTPLVPLNESKTLTFSISKEQQNSIYVSNHIKNIEEIMKIKSPLNQDTLDSVTKSLVWLDNHRKSLLNQSQKGKKDTPPSVENQLTRIEKITTDYDTMRILQQGHPLSKIKQHHLQKPVFDNKEEFVNYTQSLSKLSTTTNGKVFPENVFIFHILYQYLKPNNLQDNTTKQFVSAKMMSIMRIVEKLNNQGRSMELVQMIREELDPKTLNIKEGSKFKNQVEFLTWLDRQSVVKAKPKVP